MHCQGQCTRVYRQSLSQCKIHLCFVFYSSMNVKVDARKMVGIHIPNVCVTIFVLRATAGTIGLGNA